MIDDELRRKIETGGLRSVCPEASKMIHDLIGDFCKSLEDRNDNLAEDFESGAPGGNDLDVIPTPDPKKKNPSKQELAKRKINGLAKPR